MAVVEILRMPKCHSLFYTTITRLASRDGAGYVKKRHKKLLKMVLGIRKSRARENS